MIDLDPADPGAYYWRGVSKAKIGAHASAIADYTAAITINPADAGAYYGRGVSKAELEDHAGAIEDLTTAIGFNPDYAGAYYVRGLVKYSSGTVRGGERRFREGGALWRAAGETLRGSALHLQLGTPQRMITGPGRERRPPADSGRSVQAQASQSQTEPPQEDYLFTLVSQETLARLREMGRQAHDKDWRRNHLGSSKGTTLAVINRQPQNNTRHHAQEAKP